jgi:hypothetical protein
MKVLVCIAIVLFALSGCITDVSTEADPSNSTAGAQDPSISVNSATCQKSYQEVYHKSWDTSSALSESVGLESFELPNGTNFLAISGSSGPFIEARWGLTVSQGDDIVYNFFVTAPVTAIGEDNNMPDEEIGASSGAYDFSWELEGIITDLAISIDAVTCA